MKNTLSLSLILASFLTLSCGSKTVTNESPGAEECKATPLKALKAGAESELKVIKDHCGKETEILLLQVTNAKLTPQVSEDQALSIYVDNVCETFPDTLVVRKNLVIGCCPEPMPTENGKKRERVFVAKFDEATGKFDTNELLSFLNTFREMPKKKKKSPAVAGAQCSNPNLKIDYEKVKQAQTAQ